jgi:hypothetical protein
VTAKQRKSRNRPHTHPYRLADAANEDIPVAKEPPDCPGNGLPQTRPESVPCSAKLPSKATDSTSTKCTTHLSR